MKERDREVETNSYREEESKVAIKRESQNLTDIVKNRTWDLERRER